MPRFGLTPKSRRGLAERDAVDELLCGGTLERIAVKGADF